MQNRSNHEGQKRDFTAPPAQDQEKTSNQTSNKKSADRMSETPFLSTMTSNKKSVDRMSPSLVLRKIAESHTLSVRIHLRARAHTYHTRTNSNACMNPRICARGLYIVCREEKGKCCSVQ